MDIPNEGAAEPPKPAEGAAPNACALPNAGAALGAPKPGAEGAPNAGAELAPKAGAGLAPNAGAEAAPKPGAAGAAQSCSMEANARGRALRSRKGGG